MPEENATPAEGAGPDPGPLPPHDVLEEADRGLYLVVYRARETARQRIVALSVAAPGALPAQQVGRFFREVRAAAQVRHPHVRPILAVGFHEDRPAFTMSWAANRRLTERRDSFREARAAAALVENLARGAAAAHAHGLLHGGLALEEVHLDESDRPQIGGFGLLPFFDSLPKDPSAVQGFDHPAYRAPEQFTGRPGAVEPATDVWALGAILYELLTGRRPFEGGGMDVVRRIASADPMPPRRLRRDLDRDLEAVVLHCLEKRPDDRYASARSLAEELERWRLGQPTVVRPPTLTQRLLRAFRGNAP